MLFLADLFQPLNELPFSAKEFAHVLPIAIPAIFGMVVLILDVYLGRGRSKASLAMITALACGLAAISAWSVWNGLEEKVVLGGALATSSFSFGMALSILMSAAVIGFAVAHHGQDSGQTGEASSSLAHGELYGLMLFGTAGMLALVVANDLVTFFVALETLSLAVYALTGVDRRHARSAEGAMKYFILGAFSAGFLLYGISLLYGATHTLRLDLLALTEIPANSVSLATTGGALILVGLLFKVGAVPFHAWTPDAYEGAPAPVTGFMSVGVKVAAFAGAMHLLKALGAAGAIGNPGIWILWMVAGLTVIAGNAGALTQNNPRRLLAYSGIAHTGYLLVGIVAMARHFSDAQTLAASKDAVAGIVFYLLAYAAANLAAFSVLCHLERRGEDIDSIDDLGGLARTQPWAALVMTLAMVSLAGIPGTGGFLGKLWVFRAGVATGDLGLVVLALLASAMSLYYYLRVVVVMYMHEPHVGTAGAGTDDPQRWCSKLAVGGTGLAIVLLGVYPTVWLLAKIVDGAEALL